MCSIYGSPKTIRDLIMSKLVNTVKPNDENIIPYKEALEKALIENNDIEISKAHVALAEIYFYEQQYQEGIEHFDSAILLAKSIGDKKLNARYIGMKGMAFLNGNIPEEGYTCFEEVLEIAEEIKDEGLESDALGSMGLVYMETGDPGLAREKFTKALALAENINDKNRVMIQKGNLGNVHLTIAAADDAYNCYAEALSIARKLKDKVSQLGYLNNIGLLRENAGNIEETISTFEEVRELAEEMNDVNGELNALHHLIRIYSQDKNKSEQTIALIERVLDLSKIEKDKKMEMHYNDMKIVFLIGLKKQKEAIEFIKSKLTTKEYQEDKKHILATLTNLGNAYYDLNELDNAQQAYDDALLLAKELSNNSSIAKLLGRLGAIYADKGDLKVSNEKLLNSIDYIKEVNDNYLLGQQYCLLAMNEKEADNIEKAEAYCNEGILAYSETKSELHISKAKELLGYIQEL